MNPRRVGRAGITATTLGLTTAALPWLAWPGLPSTTVITLLAGLLIGRQVAGLLVPTRRH